MRSMEKVSKTDRKIKTSKKKKNKIKFQQKQSCLFILRFYLFENIDFDTRKMVDEVAADYSNYLKQLNVEKAVKPSIVSRINRICWSQNHLFVAGGADLYEHRRALDSHG